MPAVRMQARNQEQARKQGDDPFAREEMPLPAPPGGPFGGGNFGLLPDLSDRRRSFVLSLIINGVILGLVVLFSLAGVHQVVQHHQEATMLFMPTMPEKPPVPVPVVHLPPPVRLTAPKIVMPKPSPVVAPPKMRQIQIHQQAPRMVPAPPVRVAPPPKPKVGLFASAHPTVEANNMHRPTLHTGGFGDPHGVRPNPNADRRPDIAAVGSFAGTPGIGKPGAGAARRGSIRGVNFGSGVAHGVPGGRDTRGTVAEAGFSNGEVGGHGRPTTGRIEHSGFGPTGYGRATPTRRVAAANSTPLRILNKPAPGYTEAARQHRVQGDVILQVRFTASGHVEVLRVVSGLGYGLDQLAQQAARRIQFKPAMRDGHAVDEVTQIHITFQLA